MQAEWPTSSIKDCLDDEFPGEWGNTPKPVPANALVLRSTNLDDDGHVDLAGGAPRLVPVQKLAAKKLKDGDILLEGSGGGPGKPVGRVAFFRDDGNGPYICSNFFRTLRPGKNTDPGFLSRRLLHLYKSPIIRRFQQQTTGIINLKHKDYLDQQILLPPLHEQRRIAEILDTLDEAIRKTEQVIAKLQQMKQGLLHDLLTRGIDENGELRDPERHPEQFKDSPLGRIPREWGVASGSEICLRIEVGIVIRPTQYYAPKGIPVLRSANVHAGRIDPSDLKFMSEKDHAQMSKSAVSPGDLVTVRTGYPGTTAVIPKGLAQANCVDIIISRPGPLVLPEYLSTWINSDQAKEQVLRVQGGLAQQHFNVGEMRKMLVALPSKEEQGRIVDTVASAERQLACELLEADKLRTLKQGLMDDLLTGRVRACVEPEAAAA